MKSRTKRSVESIPKLTIKQDDDRVILKLEDLMSEKPRASIKEIDATQRLVKMLKNQKKYTDSIKRKASK